MLVVAYRHCGEYRDYGRDIDMGYIALVESSDFEGGGCYFAFVESKDFDDFGYFDFEDRGCYFAFVERKDFDDFDERMDLDLDLHVGYDYTAYDAAVFAEA